MIIKDQIAAVYFIYKKTLCASDEKAGLGKLNKWGCRKMFIIVNRFKIDALTTTQAVDYNELFFIWLF